MSQSFWPLLGICTSTSTQVCLLSSGSIHDVGCLLKGFGTLPFGRGSGGESCFSHLAVRSSGVRSITHSFSVSQACSADECFHTSSQVPGAAALTIGPTLATQLPVPCRPTPPVKMKTSLPKRSVLGPKFPNYFGLFPWNSVCRQFSQGELSTPWFLPALLTCCLN